MKYLILTLFLPVLVFNSFLYSQQNGDSLYVGRACNIILFSGYEAEGIITLRNPDTVNLKTELIELKVPLKDIRLVTEQGVSLQHVLAREDKERLDAFVTELRVQKKKRPKPIIDSSSICDTSSSCDIYLLDKRKMKDVSMINVNDTIFDVLKDTVVRHIKYSDVKKIVFKSKYVNGLYGGLIGSVSSFFLSYLIFSRGSGDGGGYVVIGSTLVAVCGFFVGSAVGLIVSRGDEYKFDKIDITTKIKQIKCIIRKHKH